jgi:hypothetical protein
MILTDDPNFCSLFSSWQFKPWYSFLGDFDPLTQNNRVNSAVIFQTEASSLRSNKLAISLNKVNGSYKTFSMFNASC